MRPIRVYAALASSVSVVAIVVASSPKSNAGTVILFILLPGCGGRVCQVIAGVLAGIALLSNYTGSHSSRLGSRVTMALPPRQQYSFGATQRISWIALWKAV